MTSSPKFVKIGRRKRKKAEALGIRVVHLRLGHVLGKGGGLLQTMLPPFYIGAGGRLGSGTQWMSWIHIDDVAGIILYAIENQHVTGALNATTPESCKKHRVHKDAWSANSAPHPFSRAYFCLEVALRRVHRFCVDESARSSAEDFVDGL